MLVVRIKTISRLRRLDRDHIPAAAAVATTTTTTIIIAHLLFPYNS